MDRASFLASGLALLATAAPAAASTPMKSVAGFSLPDTDLAAEAAGIAKAALPIEIYNHSMRTYLFAELVAKASNIDHDAELVFVASILHDTGMASTYMSDSRPFEVDGAELSRTLLQKHGVSKDRGMLVWDAIALHDNGGIASLKQPEVMLVNAGVSADFGGNLDSMSAQQIRDVLAAAPRTGFIDAFLNAAAAVAKRKPLACAHSFVADVGERRVHGFSLPNFCDEVKDDPFASYG
jgi:HD domain